MKSFIIALFVFVALPLFAQDYKVLIDEKKNEPMLVGIITKNLLADDSTFGIWFKEHYDGYILHEGTVEKISSDFTGLNIILVMGTWCGDSKEFVPSFYKLIDRISFPEQSIKLIAIDRKKMGLLNETEGLNIEKVPTFIFYKNGIEIGRIIESPEKSIEKDFLKILNGN